jgi:hypothetical protein
MQNTPTELLRPQASAWRTKLITAKNSILYLIQFLRTTFTRNIHEPLQIGDPECNRYGIKGKSIDMGLTTVAIHNYLTHAAYFAHT